MILGQLREALDLGGSLESLPHATPVVCGNTSGDIFPVIDISLADVIGNGKVTRSVVIRFSLEEEER